MEDLPELQEGWHKEAILILLEFLQGQGLPLSMKTLEEESGVGPHEVFPKEIALLRGLILNGEWGDAESFLRPLKARPQVDYRKMRFELRKQRFLEIFQAHGRRASQQQSPDTKEEDGPVAVLVDALKGLEELCSKEQFDELCVCLTLPRVRDHPAYTKWTVYGGRLACFNTLRAKLAPVYPAPAKALVDAQRLELLFRQAEAFQLHAFEKAHSTAEHGTHERWSLLKDYGESLKKDTRPATAKEKEKLKVSTAAPSSPPKHDSVNGVEGGLPEAPGTSGKNRHSPPRLVEHKVQSERKDAGLSASIQSESRIVKAPDGHRRRNSNGDLVEKEEAGRPETSGEVAVKPQGLHKLRMQMDRADSLTTRASPRDSPHKTLTSLSSDLLQRTMSNSQRRFSELSQAGEEKDHNHRQHPSGTEHDDSPNHKRNSRPPSPPKSTPSSPPRHATRTTSSNSAARSALEAPAQHRPASSAQEALPAPHRSASSAQELTAQHRSASSAQESVPAQHRSLADPSPLRDADQNARSKLRSNGMQLGPTSISAGSGASTSMSLRTAAAAKLYSTMDPEQSFSSAVILKDAQPIRTVAWDRDGDFLAIGSNSRTLRVCSVWGYAVSEGGKPLPPKGESLGAKVATEQRDWHLGSVYTVGWNANGTLLATGSNDQAVKVASIRRGAAGGEFEFGGGHPGEVLLEGHDGTVRDLAFSAVAEHVVISGGAGDCAIRAWDCAAASCLSTLIGSLSPVFALRTAPDGRTVVSGGGECSLRVWDLRSGTCVRQLASHTAQVSSLALAWEGQGGPQVIGGYSDGLCRVLDLGTGKEVRSLTHHSADCRSVDVSPGGRWLLTGGFDGAVGLVDVRNNFKVGGLWRAHNDKVIQARWHPGGIGFATSSADRTVRIWAVAAPG